MVQIELPNEVAAELQELAKRDERPLSDLVTEAMVAYVSFRYA